MSMHYLRSIRASATLILALCILLISCKDEVIDTTNPSNLVVEIINLNDGSGTVEVNATANNATSYEFYPVEVLVEDPITNIKNIQLNLNYCGPQTTILQIPKTFFSNIMQVIMII